MAPAVFEEACPSPWTMAKRRVRWLLNMMIPTFVATEDGEEGVPRYSYAAVSSTAYAHLPRYMQVVEVAVLATTAEHLLIPLVSVTTVWKRPVLSSELQAATGIAPCQVRAWCPPNVTALVELCGMTRS